MGSKRELEDVEDGEISDPSPKRAKKHMGATPRHQHQNSSIDPTWGQKYVFSALEDATTIPYGDEDDFEDDADAMAYLLSVKKEANQIPHLLIAPKVQIGPQLPSDLQKQDDDGDDLDYATVDTRGYYRDGAYIALPDEAAEESDSDEKALHEAYFSSTLKQHQHLRQILHSSPPGDVAKRLSSAHLTYAAPFNEHHKTNRIWTSILQNADPHPLQLALMSKDTVFRILRVLLGGPLLRSGSTLTQRTSRWIWGLLARLPDRGELDHVEIGWIRDLGLRAVLVGRSLAELAALQEQIAEGNDVYDGVDVSSDDERMTASDIDNHGEKEEEREEAGRRQKSEEQGEHPVADDLMNDGEEGEIQESADEEDVAMDLESSSNSDGAAEDLLEDAKRSLLARLDGASDADVKKEALDAQEEARMQLRVNLRATLNMILTIAGEVYGQRDLLEFRDPFVGL